MKIFFDVFTGDELGSDSYPIKVVDDLYYEIEGKVRRKKPCRQSKGQDHVLFRTSPKAMISMIH